MGNAGPAKTFAGMTLEQYAAAVAPSLTVRQMLPALSDQTQATLFTRGPADAVSITTTLNVVKGVVGDIAEGTDGELYKVMGYVPNPERRSGLSRPGTFKQRAQAAREQQNVSNRGI